MNKTNNQRSRTMAAVQARRATVQAMLDQVARVLAEMRREQAQITVAAVARRADVSRTFLYQNVKARALVAEASQGSANQRLNQRVEHAAYVEATWRERSLNAEHELKRAHNEITAQRSQIGELLGKIRDLELDLPDDGIQHIVTENNSLKTQIHQLTKDRQRLEERLTGARDNNRFLDKRIADLEAQLAESLVQLRPREQT